MGGLGANLNEALPLSPRGTRASKGALAQRFEGLSYDELASALELNPRSVGTFLSRAQQAFRKEYIRLYERGRHGKE